MTDGGPADKTISLRGRRVLLVANRSYSFWLFRREVIARLIEEGAEVFLASNVDNYTENLSELSINFIEISSNLNTLNPFVELKNLFVLNRAIRQTKPDVVHSFTIKPNLYCPVLAKAAGVKAVVCTVTGLGTVMIAGGLKMAVLRRVIKTIYAVSFRAANRVIVTNPDDRQFCISSGMARAEKLAVIPGAGVDLARFAPVGDEDEPQNRDRFGMDRDSLNLLFVGRMTREKGLADLVEALAAVENDRVRLHLVGEIDRKNPSALDPEELARRDPRITYHGRIDGIEKLYRCADIVVLPSYREGMPTVLMEAAACGRPAIATDVPGCREAVLDGKTGLLVPSGDVAALAGAIGKLAGSAELRDEYGRNAIAHVRQFDKKSVVAKTIELYRAVLGES